MRPVPQYYLDKIREAKEKRLKKLDLVEGFSPYGERVGKLADIPSEVFELTWLEELVLHNQGITVISTAIKQLPNLKTLNLIGNPLKNVGDVGGLILDFHQYHILKSQLVPRQVVGLTIRIQNEEPLPRLLFSILKLTALDLSNNGLTSLPESITALKNLTILDLSENKLTSLPESITALQNLTALDLSNNGPISLPESITALKNLTTLDLRNNGLTNLPESITTLQNLTTLDLSNNGLSSLPESITALQNLTTLYLSGNKLTSLPESIIGLQNLTTLYLSGNKLTSLPESITALKNLTTLDLSNNELSSLPESITALQNLTTLYLSGNKLTSLPESITTLQNLTALDLSHNGLTSLPESMTSLQNLTTLDLIYNGLTSLPESITALQNLTALYLSRNKLTSLPESMTALQNLTTLYLSKNKLTSLPESMTALQNLTTLDLSTTQLTSLPELMTALQNLTTLYLRSNGLINLPESMAALQNLTTLDLIYNELTNLPESITALQNLTTLYLSNNGLTNLPESMTALQNLTTLYLSNNGLTRLPEPMTALQNLTTLYLRSNGLINLPESMAALQNLTILDLSNNKLTNLPESMTSWQKLTTLYLRSNKLTSLPESMIALQNLTALYLSGNGLTRLPESMTSLQNLTILDLRNNGLTSLPEWITALQNLTTLDLSDNGLISPPQEVAERGVEAIRDYFRQLAQEGDDYVYEAKLLIVGEPGAGKTTLARKIEDEDYQLQTNEKSTEGIDIIQWHFPYNEERNFQVNIWDFGGQEIYHATHQFFLTKRSLYALVADTRKEDTDFYYWLNVVELLSGNSPLLIVKNEKQDRQREIPERQLRGRFTNLKEVLATNLKTKRGLPEILKHIRHYISSLPHIGDKVPKTWVKVREALEKDMRYHIPLAEYFQLCEQNGIIERKYQFQLSGYFHDLGVILHFQDEPLLAKTVILKPEWATDAVYRVLDNKTVRENFGRFSMSDLDAIWHEAKYADMRHELLQLMLKFKLCYRLDNSLDHIAPQLLSDNQPTYKWNSKYNLHLRYEYDFMPKGIITRFIVAVHHLIADSQRLVWRSGVILEREQTRAEVIQHYYGFKGEIQIRITDQHKKELLTIIIHELKQIHDSFNNLSYRQLIPCNCQTCVKRKVPHFYDFHSLKNRLAEQKRDIECQNTPYQMVDVRTLIDDALQKPDHNKNASRHRKDGYSGKANSNGLKITNDMLSFAECKKLVQCLLAIPSIADGGRRATVIDQLRVEIKTNVDYDSADRIHVFNIVNTCLKYSNGMQELRDILEFFEGDSVPMQRFDQTLRSISLSVGRD